jgi:hypothetical protein
MAFWRCDELLKKALTDEELLLTAEQAANELAEEGLPLDNNLPEINVESDYEEEETIFSQPAKRQPLLVDIDVEEDPNTNNVSEDNIPSDSDDTENGSAQASSSKSRSNNRKTPDRRWKKRYLNIHVLNYNLP